MLVPFVHGLRLDRDLSLGPLSLIGFFLSRCYLL